MVVAADEPHGLGDVGRPGARGDQRRAASRAGTSGSPARLRLWPSSPIWTIWPMIARDVDRPGERTACGSARAEDARHPAQPLDHLGAVGAVPQHLSQPLVERAPRRRCRAPRPQLEHPHRRGDDAGHRPDRAAVVARLQVTRPAASASRPPRRCRPGPRRAPRRSAHRAAGPTPGPSRSAGRRAELPRSSPSASGAGARRRAARSAAVIRSNAAGSPRPGAGRP